MGDMPTVIEKRKTLKNEAPHPPLTKTISLSAALQLYDVIMSNYAYYGFIQVMHNPLFIFHGQKKVVVENG